VPFTRSELIDATGLSAPTVGSLTAHLIRLGLLTDLGAGPSRGGRRPSHMEFNARHGFVAAIDLGSTRTHLGVADLRGDLIARRTVDTAGGATPVQLLEGLANLLLDLLREADIPIAKVLAVGAGAPGAVDPARGMVVALAPNLAQWHEVPMASILRTAISAPVVVENDVNLAVSTGRGRRAGTPRAPSCRSAPASAPASWSTTSCTTAIAAWPAKSASCAWARNT
jgi:glucokinase